MTDVISFLDSKGIQYSLETGRNGSEAVIHCPYCKKQKLYINTGTGQAQCWVCKAENPQSSPYAKTHISKIMEIYGEILKIEPLVSPVKKEVELKDFSDKVEKYHRDLLENKKGQKYLFKRGFDLEAIKKFKFGLKRKKGETWISIPSYDKGIPRLIKYRKITNNTNCKKYDRELDSNSILFNQDALDNYDEVITVEGEFDAATLIMHGYENVVGITGGAGTLKTEWYDLLRNKDKIYLVFDADPAGQNAAKDTWATRLGISRCYNILMPQGLDVNDYFKTYEKEDFDNLIEQAIQFTVDGISSLDDVFLDMYERSFAGEESEVFKLPWDSINNMLGGGLRRQRLTVVGGVPGSGKTSLAFQILFHLAKNYGIPGLFFCMEMSKKDLAIKAIQLQFNMTREEIEYKDALIYASELENVPLYLGYSSRVTPKNFYNTMEEVRNRYGVQIGVFDNLQRLVRTGEEKDMGQASGIFKDITMDLNIPFILVSQPRKLNRDRNPTIDDLKGSGAIPADADEVLLLYRKRVSAVDGSSQSLDPMTKIIIDKSRYSAGGSRILRFVGEKSRFEEEE